MFYCCMTTYPSNFNFINSKIKAIVSSATDFEFKLGVEKNFIFLIFNNSKSILSTPVPALATIFKFSAFSINSLLILIFDFIKITL